MDPAGALAARHARRGGHAGARDPLPRRHVRLPERRRAGARGLRPDHPGRVVARHRRPERRRQDHAREAAVPALRPAGAAPSRSTASTCATSTSTAGGRASTAVFQDFIRFELPLRDNVAPAGAPDDVDPGGARGRRRRAAGRARHRAGARLRGRHRPLRRAVAAHRAGARACARCGSAPAWCCSTSPPRSSTCAARPRSSTAFSPPRATRPRS